MAALISASHTTLPFTKAWPRILAMPRLMGAKHLCLHIQGQDKMQVLEKALAGQDQMEMPVRAVLHSAKPLDLYWCP